MEWMIDDEGLKKKFVNGEIISPFPVTKFLDPGLQYNKATINNQPAWIYFRTMH
jgi:hypothetical protein